MSKSAIFLKGDETTINQSIGNNRKKTLGAQNCLHFKVIISTVKNISHLSKTQTYEIVPMKKKPKKPDHIIYIIIYHHYTHYKS